MKMVNQHLCSIHLAAAAEALSLAGRLGLDQQRALDLLGRGGAASWMLADRGPRMLTPPATVNSSVDIFAKDSQLVQETAALVSAPLPGARRRADALRGCPAARSGIRRRLPDLRGPRLPVLSCVPLAVARAPAQPSSDTTRIPLHV